MLQIIIAQRGWVFVGKVTQDGDHLIVTDAKNIRRWGTHSGLGELAQEGPKEGTVLDNYGTVRIHQLAVVARIDCKEEAWI